MSATMQREAPGAKQAELMKSEMQPITRLIDSEAARERVRAVVPKNVDPGRLIRMALLSISKSDQLRRCSPESLLLSLCDAAALGLDCGGALGQAYLVPFGGTATLIIGYRGMIALARKSGEISTIDAQVVRQGDRFNYELGLKPQLAHHPMADCDAPITHAYAVCHFKDGSYQYTVMSIAEINKIKARSKASNSGPWVTDFAEMCKKTVIRRLCKMLPMTAEAAEAIDRSDSAEFGDFVTDVAQPSKPNVSDAINRTRDTMRQVETRSGGELPAPTAPAETASEPPAAQSDPADSWEENRQTGELIAGATEKPVTPSPVDAMGRGGKR